jgi:hypothetical protein
VELAAQWEVLEEGGEKGREGGEKPKTLGDKRQQGVEVGAPSRGNGSINGPSFS